MKKIVFIFFLLLFKNSSVCFSQNSWIQMSNFGGGVRNSAVSFSIGSKGYVGTGSPNNTGLNLQNDFWEFDPSTNIWTQKADFPGGARQAGIAFGINGKAYVGTGITSPYILFNDLYEYTPSTNTWVKKLKWQISQEAFAMQRSVFQSERKGTLVLVTRQQVVLCKTFGNTIHHQTAGHKSRILGVLLELKLLAFQLEIMDTSELGGFQMEFLLLSKQVKD